MVATTNRRSSEAENWKVQEVTVALHLHCVCEPVVWLKEVLFSLSCGLQRAEMCWEENMTRVRVGQAEFAPSHPYPFASRKPNSAGRPGKG